MYFLYKRNLHFFYTKIITKTAAKFTPKFKITNFLILQYIKEFL